jgi:hypothetical protein
MSWEVKGNIVSPILVNLLTALLIFFSVVVFKKPIYNLLDPDPVKDYPVYCIGEPYIDEDNTLMAEFYIINLRGHKLVEKDLATFLKISTEVKEYEVLEPDIKLTWNKVLGTGNIVDIIQCEDFNEGKGRIEIEPPKNEDGLWSIRLRELRPKAILKLIVYTNHKTIGVTRPAKVFLPYIIDYPGE